METMSILPSHAIEEIRNNQLEILAELGSLNNNLNDELVTLSQANQITKISKQKLRQMAQNNQLKSKKFGRAIRIYRSSLL